MSKPRLKISFSGGETSAYMTHRILNGPMRKMFGEIVVVFANTGQEREETLEFIHRCDRELGFGTVWIEAQQVHQKGKGALVRVVDFKTASRKGEPFEDYIAKYGVPCAPAPHCTRDLKLYPMRNYMNSIGWATKSYVSAIGIRADEMDRISSNAEADRLFYPLATVEKTTKPQINAWWARQPFRLNLKSYQGNCTWCWKKSFRVHMTLIEESPEIYDFPRRMEKKYPFRNDIHKAAFFRGGRTTDDLFEMYREKAGNFTRAVDAAAPPDQMPLFDEMMDVGGACGESCEVGADE